MTYVSTPLGGPESNGDIEPASEPVQARATILPDTRTESRLTSEQTVLLAASKGIVERAVVRHACLDPPEPAELPDDVGVAVW